VLSLIAVRSPFIRAFVSTARQTTESARQMPVKKISPIIAQSKTRPKSPVETKN